MLEIARRVFRDLRRRVGGYLAFMTNWANVRVGRPDLHPPKRPPRNEGKGDKTD